MYKFLAFCLLIVPFAHGLGLPVLSGGEDHHDDHHDDHHHDTPHHDNHHHTVRQFEEELHANISKIASHDSTDMIPPVTPNDSGEVGPVHVKVNAYFRDIVIKEIDTDFYEWTADLTFRQMWNDKRLAYDIHEHPEFKYIHLETYSSIKSLWKPDTFFRSVDEKLHHVTTPNVLMWIHPNGDILYSMRISVTLHCHPQASDGAEEGEFICPMRMASYGYTTNKLVYEWDAETPVVISDTVFVPKFTMPTVTTETHLSTTKIGEFSSLSASVHFHKK